jgi:hypothetical protein
MAIPFAIPAAVSAFVRSVQGAIIIALTAALIALALYVWGFRVAFIGFDGLADNLEDCRAAKEKAEGAIKDADIKARAAQKETERLIVQMKQRGKSAEDKASRIERIVLPGDCKTPPEILSLPI